MAKRWLFQKYGKESKQSIRTNLFQKTEVAKINDCRYRDLSQIVTISYNLHSDLFAVVDSKSNQLLDFAIATEIDSVDVFG